jgi:hypothetical protein
MSWKHSSSSLLNWPQLLLLPPLNFHQTTMKHFFLIAGALLASAHAHAQQGYRYVRFDRAQLLQEPSNSGASVASLAAGDSVQIVMPQPAANAHLSTATQFYVYARHGEQQGWMGRSMLVGQRDSCQVGKPTASLSSVKKPAGNTYVPVTQTHRPYAAGGKVVRVVATGKATPPPPVSKGTPGAVAYYCASGNIVKYHASPACQGLERCNASIKKISLQQASKDMDACQVCH